MRNLWQLYLIILDYKDGNEKKVRKKTKVRILKLILFNLMIILDDTPR